MWFKLFSLVFCSSMLRLFINEAFDIPVIVVVEALLELLEIDIRWDLSSLQFNFSLMLLQRH
ncbi:hypothetical protein Lalb_Chr25g0281411 [Lupinus albus]|uniref:Uncharacterized protein n=1 Tax=Lupinus albus TaxID=3870 RepID=A0A6A4NBB4_LUPAL|nr:hypothetical protein Lalb_Chr25g0281411 [Lupinus albus]